MARKFSLKQHSYYPWLFVLLAGIAATIAYVTAPSSESYGLVVSAVAGVAGFVYFLYSQHLQQTILFTDLFRRFNERYDELNNKINAIVARDQQAVLSAQEVQDLYDYFNLCGEEYLYFKTGFIDPQVWSAWVRGMRHFASYTPIRRLWESELNGGSYYGFTLDLVDGP
jgi:hypothetical protein